jgi:NAD(P)H dehydrogenase (quinone)
MCALTSDGGAPLSCEPGPNGEASAILIPINRGIFHFAGFAVVEPFLDHGPVRIADEARLAHLARYRERVLSLASAPAISYPKLADYDERYVLKTPPKS